jgi:uncharacterized protein (DUF58 family)
VTVAVPDDTELFDPEFLGKLRALVLRLRKRRQLRKKGVQSTPSTGFTREFKDFRHYTKNDDYRAIDWRLYARLERLFIRLYEEVQEFHLHVVIDTSNSMLDPFPAKRVVALKLAAALAYLGLVGQHRVNLYAMSNRVTHQLPPLKGQGNITKVIDALKAMEFGGVTDLERCFREFRPPRTRYGVIFAISDLYGTGPLSAETAIQRCTSWPGEVHVIQTVHPWERDPDLEGEIELVDVETGETRKMWFTKRERKRYAATFAAFVESVERASLSRQVDYVTWGTEQPFEEMFLNLLSRGSALAGSV